MIFYAHSASNPSKADWQRLNLHLFAVAKAARCSADKFGAGRLAALAGLLHDLGKYTPTFQRRLEGKAERLPHADAGARLALEYASQFEPRRMDQRLAWELVAYVISGHHAGLYGPAGLEDFVKAQETPLDPVWRSEIAPETDALWPKLGFTKEKLAFQIAFLGRMIFSCLVDADFRDTEAFFARVERRVVDRDWPTLADHVDTLIARLDAHLAGLAAKAGDVNAERDIVLRHVVSKAGDAAGVFTLTVPTGGGKTLASLAFALRHAKRHGLDRIIVAIPFTSVIDQTAAIYRGILGQDAEGRDFVLEHHSNVAFENAADEDKFRDKEPKSKLRLAMEDWAAPIVVTTNVQLFESLFSHRPSRCRKLHNLTRSLIILDEAQTIPRHVLKPCVGALDELARNYGASIVLCTATQPALRARDGFTGGFDIDDARELAPEPKTLAERMRRVTLRFAGEMDDDALVAALGEVEQGLVIVNTRGHALQLYLAAKAAGLDGLVHLTTRQCAADRRTILAGVKERLKHGQLCRVVATSLVEAGVDFSFPRVWRAEAGLDQIHQAAGRCNREGERAPEDSVVTVFKPAQNLAPPEIRQLAAAAHRALTRQNDALSLEALEAYFREVYWVKGDAGLDEYAVRDAFRLDASGTSFDYRSIGEAFRLIRSEMVPIIIAQAPEALQALADLECSNPPIGRAMRQLQPYLVQIPLRARHKLLGAGKVQFVAPQYLGGQFVRLIVDKIYSREIGLLWENAEYVAIDDLMF